MTLYIGLSTLEDACGSESCINRNMYLECSDQNCPSGYNCQNQRFQRLQYAELEVFKAGGKGFGLKARTDLPPQAFIMEYVGEVVTQSTFVKRMKAHLSEGRRHFYFMSIKAGEMIDASSKGNFSRFMNHSCSPNCQLQKWVVNNKFRMGLFTSRDVQAGEELTFDYKMERYG